MHCFHTCAVGYSLKLKSSPAAASVAVKLSGDGARFSRTSQFALLSLSLPDHAEDVLSSYGM